MSGDPSTRDQVLDQLDALATVEHALVVENLSVCCALGHDLEAGEGGATSSPGRDAAAAAYHRAQTEMFHLSGVNDLLVAAGRPPQVGRASSVADTGGTDVSLDPPTADQVQHLLERERAITSAVDAQYARLQHTVVDPPFEGDLAEQVRAVLDAGTTHTAGYDDLRAALGDPPPADVLRATRRDTEDPAELRLLAVSDRIYRELVAALGVGWGAPPDGFVGGSVVRIGVDLMPALDDTDRLLVARGLLPAFNP